MNTIAYQNDKTRTAPYATPWRRSWVKPVDNVNVKALWLPKSTLTATTWEPMLNLQWRFSSDEE